MSENEKGVSEKEENEGMKKIIAKRYFIFTDEFLDAYEHYFRIIHSVGEKYCKYAIYAKVDSELKFQDTTAEYAILYVNVYIYDIGKEDEYIGRIDIADNSLSHVTKDEQDNGYVVLYSDEYVRNTAEKIFSDWAKKKEAERDE